MASIFKSGGGTELISIYFNIHGNEQLKKITHQISSY